MVAGLILLFLGAIVGVFTFGLGFIIIGGLGLWVTICGAVVMYSATQLHANPFEHTKWGAIILVFSIIGGWSIIDFIGGLLALIYQPIVATPQQYTPPQQSYYGPTPQQASYTTTQACTQCGTTIQTGTKFCPHCGKQQY